jgi:hypothetical protein
VCVLTWMHILMTVTHHTDSLLQSLFQTTEFRQAVYSWKYDDNRHGDRDKCIPLQLQILFAQLELTSKSAVSTTQLTKAFGWSSAEAFTQHDIQELTCILFEALEQSDRNHFKAATKLWRGTSCGFIQPKMMTDPSQRHERNEEFMDIQVPIRGHETLESALKQVVAIENMDGDNQWHCDELNQKVDAVKGTSFKKLPSILSLHLMRFQFDPVTYRRMKVLDALSFPESIDLGFLLDEGPDHVSAGSVVYDLTTILMHSGTADRGHYYAFIKDQWSRQWACYNDANVHLLDKSEEDAIFNAVRGDGIEDKDKLTPHNSSSNAYMLVYRLRTCDPADNKVEHSIDSGLQQVIQEENKEWGVLSECYNIHQQMVELVIYPPCAVLATSEDTVVPKVSLLLHQSYTYQELLEEARKQCFLNRDWSMSLDTTMFTRLRKFNLHLRRAGETFGTKQLCTLCSLGFGLHATLIMEFSASNQWVEFNPNEMSLKLIVWNAESHEPGDVVEVIVPGEYEATVQGAKLVAANALLTEGTKVDELLKLVRLVRVDNNQANLLDDDTVLYTFEFIHCSCYFSMFKAIIFILYVCEMIKQIIIVVAAQASEHLAWGVYLR